MAYGSILGQNPTAQNTLYNNAQTSSIITANNVQGAIDQLFTSVSNGKQQIASAITDKGVSTSGNDTFATMAENIGKISTGISPGSYRGTSKSLDARDTSYTNWERIPEGTFQVMVGIDTGFGIFNSSFSNTISLFRVNYTVYFRIYNNYLQYHFSRSMSGSLSAYYIFS